MNRNISENRFNLKTLRLIPA